MATGTFGPSAVDWESGVDLARLRDQRLTRLKDALAASEPGAARRDACTRCREHIDRAIALVRPAALRYRKSWSRRTAAR